MSTFYNSVLRHVDKEFFDFTCVEKWSYLSEKINDEDQSLDYRDPLNVKRTGLYFNFKVVGFIH